MKRLIAIFLAVMLTVSLVNPAFAANSTKGPSSRAYEKASDESAINRVGDWFATVGKSDTEKQKVLKERKVKRLQEKAKKEKAKRQKELDRKRKEMQKKSASKMKSYK